MARQKLGQHFLSNASILQRIAEAVCASWPGAVIEIGPGRGALTAELLKRAPRVVAVELDPALSAYLRARFSGDSRLDLVEADALETDLRQFGEAVVAGNLPYYAATAIIERTLRAGPPKAVFLIQKDVALRLCAQPGERDYGYLTVRTAVFAEARILFDVRPGAFRPPPKVDSSVVLLEPRKRPAVEDVEAFLEFAGQCFAHKRKTIRNNLAAIYGKDSVDAWPEAGMRAEEIPLARFAEMYRRLRAQRNER